MLLWFHRIYYALSIMLSLHRFPKIILHWISYLPLFPVSIHAINRPRTQLSRKLQAIECIESTRMQSEILQFALCHLFRSFPADLVPPWLLSGNTYAKVLIRATYCNNPSRPDCWNNLSDDRTATSSECTRLDCIQTPFRCMVSILLFDSISINYLFSLKIHIFYIVTT